MILLISFVLKILEQLEVEIEVMLAGSIRCNEEDVKS